MDADILVFNNRGVRGSYDNEKKMQANFPNDNDTTFCAID